MFQSARIKLTGWYLLIIMLVSISFSVVIYRFLTTEVERFEQMQRFRMERRMREGLLFPIDQPILPVNTELIDELKQRIGIILISVNGVILVIAGGLGYILAGKTLKPIADMVTEQQRFVSDASHELKTPLTSLKSAFEVYLRDKNRTKKDADTIVTESISEVNKLQSLTESLLALTHTSSVPKSNWQTVAVKMLVSDAAKSVTSIASQKSIQIATESEDLFVSGQFENLSRVLIILLENAIKYSNQKTIISIQAHKKDTMASIAISDEGIGIDKHDIAHIFDRFYRADVARSKTGANGFGLGLSIAKRIIENHRGTITVQSEKDKGSTFTVLLPLAKNSKRSE